jgi:glycosyltransferase involved in cell wall biosynthesis
MLAPITMTDETRRSLTVGIVTIRERFQLMRRLLKSVFEQDYPSTKLEVLLVPNMESGEWHLLANALGELNHPNLRVLPAKKRTLGAARNEILEEAQGEILLFLDDDCWLPDRAHLSRRETLHRLHPDRVIGGKYASDPTGDRRNFYNEICNLWFDLDVQGWKLLGGNISYPMNLVRQHQASFDSQQDHGGNENPMNLMLWNRGVGFHKAESLTVGHEESLSLVHLGKKAFRQGRARALENRPPKSRPTVGRLVKTALQHGFKWGHVGFFCLGEIGYVSKKLEKFFPER